ncbi:retrovirus-related pol polyprotein from transposon TNT 1-94 [Tanacetum coccineum]
MWAYGGRGVNGKKYILVIVEDYLALHSENLGKLQPKADIGIFIGYAPMKKAFRIYNRRTRRIIETIHVDFDELTALASEHSSLGPALHEMTPVSISSRLVPNPPSSTPFVPPSRSNWDLLFQPMFDESLNPLPYVDLQAPEVIAPIPEVVAHEHAISTGSPSSTTVDQDAPSPSNSPTTQETQTLIISHDVEEDNHDMKMHYWIPPLVGENPNWMRIKKGSLLCSCRSIHIVGSAYRKALKCGKKDLSVSKGLYLGDSGIRSDFFALKTKAFEDADHCWLEDTRRRNHGSKTKFWVIIRLVSWSSKRQKSAAISNTEAEYIALSVREYHLADIFTKRLAEKRIEFLINKLGVMRRFTPETLKKLAADVTNMVAVGLEHAEYDESNTYVLERFNTTAGNPVKKILLKLNLSDHRLFKDGGGVKEFQRSFRHSDTERLSRSDEVLKLKNFKKDATLKLFKSTNQVRYEHVGPTITSSQDGKVNKMAKRDYAWLMISRFSSTLQMLFPKRTITTPEFLLYYTAMIRPSHDGCRNTIELLDRNNVVPLRSNTIRLVQNGCSFHGLRFEDPNQHLKDFLKLLESLDLDVANRERTNMRLFQFSLHDQASNWLERLPAGFIST